MFKISEREIFKENLLKIFLEKNLKLANDFQNLRFL